MVGGIQLSSHLSEVRPVSESCDLWKGYLAFIPTPYLSFLNYKIVSSTNF